ncbi:hypothetical protein RC74_20535 [Falsihalocynthiibacter arcticus]|uniref:Uncharacterized protein n=1 Tax=Falsihalocynthiibacter arcticus TaxID=1579316 RepID=A0A126V4U1_9RHOB|nr:hypothetical protein RC74_20535 [Falsihalocynthiibacter arcticus]
MLSGGFLRDLSWVAQNETSSRERNPVNRPKCAAEIDGSVDSGSFRILPSEFAAEIPHHVNIRAREPINRLPIVPDCENLSVRMLGLQGAYNYVLEIDAVAYAL